MNFASVGLYLSSSVSHIAVTDIFDAVTQDCHWKIKKRNADLSSAKMKMYSMI